MQENGNEMKEKELECKVNGTKMDHMVLMVHHQSCRPVDLRVHLVLTINNLAWDPL